jgi:hypothetical protein
MAVNRRPEFDRKKGGIQKLWSQAPEANVSSLLELYHTSPRMDAIDIKAQHIAAPGRSITAAWTSPDEAQPIKNHPAIDLLMNPCPAYPEIDGAVLMYLTYVYKRVTGEAYWWKIRNGSAIESLYIMPKSWCLETPSYRSPYFLFIPYGVAGGSTIKAAPEDIVWFKSPTRRPDSAAAPRISDDTSHDCRNTKKLLRQRPPPIPYTTGYLKSIR